MTKPQHCRKRFDAIATDYAKHRLMQEEHLARLMMRFDYLKGDFPQILDLGCGPGEGSAKLKKIFPKSEVIALDISSIMLQLAKAKRAFFHPFRCLQADAMMLPFADESFDLLVAHHLLPYLPDMSIAFAEWHRVLKPGGGIILTSLGPDTYQEVKRAFNEVDNHAHVHDFLDLHDIGDALLKQGFLDPVIDREDLILRFQDQKQLLQHLRAQGGMINRRESRKSLLSPRQYQKFKEALPLTLTHELITAHAWRGKTVSRDGAQIISLASLKASLPPHNIKK